MTSPQLTTASEPPVFTPWPKIPRLFRECTITEKIDGTNAAIHIVPWVPQYPDLAEAFALQTSSFHFPVQTVAKMVNTGNGVQSVMYGLWCQSRKRLLHANPGGDNHGFAAWVQQHAETLVDDLGEGLHYGEWWGSGINRGYGLQHGEKRFSLFNTKRWAGETFKTPGMACVPVIGEGVFDTDDVRKCLRDLQEVGSWAAPGFMRPEGVVVFHKAANEMFKVTYDDMPKGQ